MKDTGKGVSGQLRHTRLGVELSHAVALSRGAVPQSDAAASDGLGEVEDERARHRNKVRLTRQLAEHHRLVKRSDPPPRLCGQVTCCELVD